MNISIQTYIHETWEAGFFPSKENLLNIAANVASIATTGQRIMERRMCESCNKQWLYEPPFTSANYTCPYCGHHNP